MPCAQGGLEGESNDSEGTAKNLGTISDSDGDGDTISGVIAGAGDVDWFRYDGKDEFLNSVDPTREFLANGAQLRICKFIQCNKGNPDFGACPSGTTSQISPEGRPGCCGSFGFSLSLECGGALQTDESATVYMRVDSPAGETCAEYTINYHF